MQCTLDIYRSICSAIKWSLEITADGYFVTSNGAFYDAIQAAYIVLSRGTKVEKMLTLAPERYTAGFCMVAKIILWCI